MKGARRFKKDWDGNRKRDTASRCTKHQLGDCNIFKGDREAVNFLGNREAVNSAKPGTRADCVLCVAARDEFPASRGVLSLTLPEEVGGHEVKQ